MSTMTNPTEKRGVCETNINEIKEIFCQIDLIKRDPRFFIYDHFSVLKNKVDLRREIISAEGDPNYDLEKTYINLIEQVEEAEKTCEENLSSFEVISTSLVDEEKALKQRLDILTESLDSLSLDSVFHEALKLKKNAENFFEVCKDGINIEILRFQPNKPIIFDDSLDIKNLKIFSGSSDLWIILTNFKGIDLSSNPFNDLERTINFNFDLIFDFYVNKKLIDKTNCNDRIPSRSIIQQAFSLIVTNPNKNSGETCPFVFKNSLLKLFSIKFLRYSLIYTSSFTFQNKSIQNNNLNCSIFRTDLEIFHSDLNSKLLNAHVFRNLTILNIDGIINRIEADVFKNLKELRFLRIKSQNVKKIFSRDNKWFQYLNKNDVIERFYFFLHQLYENVTFYSYPEEDFCFLIRNIFI